MELTISLDPKDQFQLEQIAQSAGKSPEEVIGEAILEYVDRVNKQRLETEIQAFEQMHSELKKKYLNQFVAIYDQQVVDADNDFEALFMRVESRYGSMPVLIRQVSELPTEEWRFRSPRLDHS